MLVLTRKKDQTIHLRNKFGTFAVITIVNTSPAHCRVGVSAPGSVEVVRGELIIDGELSSESEKVLGPS